jgi:hypothetical protein
MCPTNKIRAILIFTGVGNLFTSIAAVLLEYSPFSGIFALALSYCPCVAKCTRKAMSCGPPPCRTTGPQPLVLFPGASISQRTPFWHCPAHAVNSEEEAGVLGRISSVRRVAPRTSSAGRLSFLVEFPLSISCSGPPADRLSCGIGISTYGLAGRKHGGCRHRKFGDNLRQAQDEKKWIVMLGRAGFAARGGVLVLIDAFLTKAALQYDPDQATGIAGALRALQGTSYGAPLLGVTAVGLACFGLFELGQARRGSPHRQARPARLA